MLLQKGKHLAGISKKLYGDTSACKGDIQMNGLSDGNLIYIGQNCYSKWEMCYTKVHSIRRNVERMTKRMKHKERITNLHVVRGCIC